METFQGYQPKLAHIVGVDPANTNDLWLEHMLIVAPNETYGLIRQYNMPCQNPTAAFNSLKYMVTDPEQGESICEQLVTFDPMWEDYAATWFKLMMKNDSSSNSNNSSNSSNSNATVNEDNKPKSTFSDTHKAIKCASDDLMCTIKELFTITLKPAHIFWGIVIVGGLYLVFSNNNSKSN